MIAMLNLKLKKMKEKKRARKTASANMEMVQHLRQNIDEAFDGFSLSL